MIFVLALLACKGPEENETDGSGWEAPDWLTDGLPDPTDTDHEDGRDDLTIETGYYYPPYDSGYYYYETDPPDTDIPDTDEPIDTDSPEIPEFELVKGVFGTVYGYYALVVLYETEGSCADVFGSYYYYPNGMYYYLSRYNAVSAPEDWVGVYGACEGGLCLDSAFWLKDYDYGYFEGAELVIASADAHYVDVTWTVEGVSGGNAPV